MCGLLGFLGGDFIHSEAGSVLNKMVSKLAHRGPDDSGVWFDEHSVIGFGHTRLSILELSSAGSQPMLSSTGNPPEK